MIRIGVDFGGTKIEAAALDASGKMLSRLRKPTPREYDPAIRAVCELVAETEAACGSCERIGFAIPGSISPRTGVVRNANSTFLNGRPFAQDLERTLGRPVRLANDANCLAVSEAADGAGAGCGVVFAMILGTGVGGGVAVNGQPVGGGNGVAGEVGHMPLPWASPRETPGPDCWCGLNGCLELYVSGPAFERDHHALGGPPLSAPQVVQAARAGGAAAMEALDRYVERLARGLAVIVDVLDPDVIVLGGGMSNVEELYDRLPAAIEPRVFSDMFETPIRRAMHGDSSGVRGAAWLWPLEEQ
jgi:fructokinase